MSDDAQRFANYENSMTIYRTKSAMAMGVLYFNKGYASTPVLAIQFAEVNDEKAEQKTFNWETENRIWWFRSYDAIYEFYKKLGKWKQIITHAKQQGITDSNVLSEKYKDFAEKNKISNPIKKKTLYMNVRFYNVYFFGMTLASSNLPNKSISVSLYEDELDMIIQYIGDFIKNYHQLVLIHRQLAVARGFGKSDAATSNDGDSSVGKRSSSSSAGNKKEAPSGGSKKASEPDAVESLLGGGALDSLMQGIGGDDDIPF